MPEPKKVPYSLIPPVLTTDDGEVPNHIYVMMEEIKTAHHLPGLAYCKVALMWRKEWKPDRDGIIPLGRAMKISDREKQLVEYDVMILLNYEWWNDPRTTPAQKQALLDHELCHFKPVLDDPEDPDSTYRNDETGRTLFYLRKHDIEEFQEIIARHGLYKDDLQRTYAVMRAAEERTENPPESGDLAT